MRPLHRLGTFDRLAAAAGGGDREAMSRLHATVRPMVIRHCRAELDPAIADAVADGACSAVLHALADRTATGEPFLHLLNTMTSAAITRTVAASCGRRAPRPARLAVLCTRERDVLILRLIVGLGTEDTATSLGRTPGDVLLDQHRALQALRGVLAADRGTAPL